MRSRMLSVAGAALLGVAVLVPSATAQDGGGLVGIIKSWLAPSDRLIGPRPTPAARKPKDFAASTVSLDLKDVRVRTVLRKIAELSGNAFVVAGQTDNRKLASFECDGEPFWQAIDRLGKVSGNFYHWKTGNW